MSEPLLTIRNKHSPVCGDPPIVVSTANRSTYLGYFENMHGEQWIFTFDRATGLAELRGGDLGWNTPLTIQCDTQGNFRIEPMGVNLSTEEKLWLLACWQAATGGKPQGMIDR